MDYLLEGIDQNLAQQIMKQPLKSWIDFKTARLKYEKSIKDSAFTFIHTLYTNHLSQNSVRRFQFVNGHFKLRG